MNSRIQEIDVLRAFAILFIVFSHIDSYTKSPFFEKWDALFAFLGLSLFFIISGYLLYYRVNFNSDKEILLSLKKRAWAIYPLYWISILISYAMTDMFNLNILALDPFHLVNKKILFLNIVGFQGLMSEDHSLFIWWFIGTILLYYIIFYTLLYFSKNTKIFILLSFVPLFALIILRDTFGIIHISTLQYYPVFIVGVIVSQINDFSSLKYLITYYVGLLVMILILKLTLQSLAMYDIITLMKRPFMILPLVGCIVGYKMKLTFSNRYKMPSLISDIAYSSYAIYLFHLQIFTVFEFALNPLIKGFSSIVTDLIVIVIGIPIVIFIGYKIQNMERLIKSWL